MKRIYGIIGLLFLGGYGMAQPLTLQQYRQKVLDYNQEIKQSQEAVKAAPLYVEKYKNWIFSPGRYDRKLFLSDRRRSV